MRPGRAQYEEVGVMVKCKNCGMELGPEETCVFATYKVEKEGNELMVCCERCSGHLEEAPPLEAAPVHPVASQTANVLPATPLEAPGKAAPPEKKVRKAPLRKAVKRAAARKLMKKGVKRAAARKLMKKTVKKTAPRKRPKKMVKRAAPRRRRK
jgi:hypothetical protein